MAAKNVEQCIDAIEEVVEAVQDELHQEVGNLKEELQNMNKRLDILIKLQEDSARIASSSAGKAKETAALSSIGGESHGASGTTFFSVGSRQDFRFRKLEMPIFDGTNPDGGILKAERYFTLHRLTNEEKLEVAIISFEGDALLWFQWENKKRSMVLWEEMKLLLLKQFPSTQAGSLHEQWLALKQEGSFHEYQRRFIEFFAPLDNVAEEFALRNFINGLKPNIRVEVRIMGSSNLGRAMELAQRIEEKMLVTGSHRAIGGYSNSRVGSSIVRDGWGSRTAQETTGGFRSPVGGGAASTKPYGEVRRLTDS